MARNQIIIKKIKPAVIALDTSNYTTSVSAADINGGIIVDKRKLLEVKKGERGLRQSHALFQHMTNLPELLESAVSAIRDAGFEIRAVAASDRPRPQRGSYMPVFLVGTNFAKSIACALGTPTYFFSHQEGHIAAVCGALPEDSHMLSFHISGGTGEIVEVLGGVPASIIGGVKDISFGQLIDRIGVALGYGFPAGREMDSIAMDHCGGAAYRYSRKNHIIIEGSRMKPIRVEGCSVNLSGIETECLRAVSEGCPAEILVPELFLLISDALFQLTVNACRKSGTDSMVYAGGVAASGFIRETLTKRLRSAGINAIFGEPAMSSDNAVGTALLGAARANTEIS